MRVLCLHGRGTSGAIFQSQTFAVREKLKELDPSITFEFVDGPFATPPAPGIDTLFGTTTYGWWQQDSAANIRNAQDWLDKYLAAHGPYDALMGFSQGGALIGSYLMNWSRDQSRASAALGTPAKPPPVRAAIFICSGLAVCSLEDLGVDVTPKAREVDKNSREGLDRKTAYFRELMKNPDLIQRGVGLWDDTSDLGHVPGGPLPKEDDAFGLDFTSFPPDVFIRIPTIHVYGSKDPRYPAGIQNAYICPTREMYDHGGGHDIPRTTVVSLKIAHMIHDLLEDA